MNYKMKTVMDEKWKQWHGSDIDTPRTSIAFERGFCVAFELLAPVVRDLIDVMERLARDEFDEEFHPVTSAEWFNAIKNTKAVIDE